MPTPNISILMAVYNGARCLSATIESMLRQTHREFEFVIVDDGSSDGTVAAVKAFDDPRIVLHRNQTNIGQTASLNVGLNLCTSDYVARIDAGDFSLPTRLAKQAMFLQHFDDCAAVGSAAVMVDADGRKLGIARRPANMPQVLLHMFHVSPLIHVSTLFRRKVVLDAGGYDEGFHITADHELWSKLIRSGHTITSLPRPLVGYKIDPGSLSREHLEGRVTEEAAEVARRNARDLAGVDLSIDQARDIFRMFTFGIDALDDDIVAAAEANYRRIFETLRDDLRCRVQPRAVRRHLMRNYVKQALREISAGRSAEARQTLRRGQRRHGASAVSAAVWAASFLGKAAARCLPGPAARTDES